MTKHWIVLTREGETFDDSERTTNNLQVLGFAEGETFEEAKENFEKEHQYIYENTDFERASMICLGEERKEIEFDLIVGGLN